ncbi:exodeoxyribonuclease VII large subunit [Elusimicrobium simillimum]|uniref:exodeoxyribonuclease VII large subunit n=1 Tax=Elusimicrobium simillimum TaxID=3143438 RepID=UPI003C705F90
MGLTENKIFSVTEISLAIKEMLEGVLADVRIEGEISGLKKASSGHIYFDIKDENALISAVLFKGYARYTADLKDGLKVLVRGDLSCYIKQGRYQVIVKSIVPVSTGDLYLEFERLKQKLAAEGLFDQARKRPLPEHSSIIGVVTSPTGAAFQDILSVLKRRSPNVNVILSPTLVQGAGAGKQIAEAIKKLNKLKPRPDVILVGRGGGSMEDLWCFNEEVVARAIAASKAPIISCVGHETDFTIADFVADLRAPTPSAAAEIVVQNSASVKEYLGQLARRLAQNTNIMCLRAQNRISYALASPFFKNPADVLARKEQDIDILSDALNNAYAIKQKDFAHKLNVLTHKLEALNPSAILKRGFSIVRKDGVLVRSVSQVNNGDILEVQVADGKFNTEKKNA